MEVDINEGITKEEWVKLKDQAKILIVNSKIGLHQGLALLELSKTKISEFELQEEKSATAEEVVKELIELAK